jgi:hypothetical protein
MRILITILSLSFLLYCSLSQKSEQSSPEISPLSLSFSSVHQSYYLDAHKAEMNETEANQFFDTILEKSNTVCEMIWGKKKMDKTYVETFITKETFGKRPFENWWHPLPKMIAGCWNFFKMNDVNPHLDYELVKNLFPSEKKDCFTVGFMQPYIMYNVLGCERVTVVDIDIRIHHGHWQMLKMFKENAFTDEPGLTKSLTKLNLGWVAFEEQEFGRVMKVNIGSVCKPDKKKYCTSHLLDFQKRFNPALKFRLLLSFLHDADFSTLPGTMPVIYFSNALENIYTSKEEFEQILVNIGKNMKPEQKAALIYHAGGQINFGVYEYTKKESGHEIKTICKDAYVGGHNGEYYFYKTYFEKFYPSKEKIVACQRHPLLTKPVSKN